MESAGKRAAIYGKRPSRDWLGKKTMGKRYQSTIFKLNTNFFCRQRTESEVFMKMASRADTWKGERPWAKIENLQSS